MTSKDPLAREARFAELVAMYLACTASLAAIVTELETMSDLMTPEVRRILTGGISGN